MSTARPRFNKTKLVATLGPASSDKKTMKKLILAGVDVFRVNFSHGSADQHLETINKIREINDTMGTHVAILGDLQGPKMRIGDMGEGVTISAGERVTLCTEPEEGSIHVKYPKLAQEVDPGEVVLLDDGKIQMRFERILDEKRVEAEVLVGGVLHSNKGFNLPSSNLSVECLTEKDLVDLDFAIAHEFDWIALSFVRKAEDIYKLREILDKHESGTNIIAKIEKPQAVEDLDRIIEASDAVMVARGDLGVELPMEQVPLIQKRIVRRCNEMSKPVIIATQMMESMIDNPTPTRAEANDVANAVMDGADAVMLSAETAVGNYPMEAVEAVEKILRRIENEWDIYNRTQMPDPSSRTFLSDEICFMAVSLAANISAKAIISMTQTGYTAYAIASRRPNSHIFIFTSNKQLLTQLSLVWNIKVYFYDKRSNTDQTVQDVIARLKGEGWLQTDDVVINTAAMPAMENRKTNTLKITQVR